MTSPIFDKLRSDGFEQVLFSHDAALRLAQTMTLKGAAAGLDLGGGWSVVIGDPHRDKTEDLPSST